ncbi:MAG: hypothetical protein KAT46_03090 [Deltaproteobacteria bacterium]|nr:hypothetical protein [Deltaproteobacteria bacterium]
MTEYVKTFTCKNCNAPTSGRGHLCHPNSNHPGADKEAFECEFCKKKDIDARHTCPEMLDSIEYVCKKCGRLAVYDSLLCEPELIG